jgi:hypothetical protein
MNRPYQNTVSKSVEFFVGDEVEHTATYGMKTLFVSGLHDASLVIDRVSQYQVKHVYFGANHTFHQVTDSLVVDQWQIMIDTVLQFGLWVTLDIDSSQLCLISNRQFIKHDQFVPMLRVAIPHVLELNYNTVIKIDDVDFQATNPGVWCWNLKDLTVRSVFTHWSKYTQDQIIK